MKAIELIKMKAVSYHGTEVYVPENIHFIATDKNGTTIGFEERPVVDHGFNFWDNPNCSDMYEIGTFDLEGSDWTKTLVVL